MTLQSLLLMLIPLSLPLPTLLLLLLLLGPDAEPFRSSSPNRARRKWRRYDWLIGVMR